MAKYSLLLSRPSGSLALSLISLTLSPLMNPWSSVNVIVEDAILLPVPTARPTLYILHRTLLCVRHHDTAQVVRRCSTLRDDNIQFVIYLGTNSISLGVVSGGVGLVCLLIQIQVTSRCNTDSLRYINRVKLNIDCRTYTLTRRNDV